MEIGSDNVSKNDMMFFQNEVLMDIKKLDHKLNGKIDEKNTELTDKITKTEQKVSLLVTQISEIINSIATNKSNEDKISNFLNFKQKTEESLFVYDSKIHSLEKDISNAVYKFDNIINNTILVPGLIGNSCKYPSVKTFLNYTNKTILDLLSFKEKNLVDLKSYKNKLENLIQQFHLQIENVQTKFVEYVNKRFNEMENKLMDRIKITDDRIDVLRLENGKYANELIEKSDNLQIEWNKLDEFEKKIEEKLKEEINNFKIINNNTVLKFNENQNEFKLIKQKFTKLSDFISDVRFRKNLGQNVPFKAFKEMGKAINFSKKQKLEEDSLSKSDLSADLMKIKNNDLYSLNLDDDDYKIGSPISYRMSVRKRDINLLKGENDNKNNKSHLNNKNKRTSMFNVDSDNEKKKKSEDDLVLNLIAVEPENNNNNNNNESKKQIQQDELSEINSPKSISNNNNDNINQKEEKKDDNLININKKENSSINENKKENILINDNKKENSSNNDNKKENISINDNNNSQIETKREIISNKSNNENKLNKLNKSRNHKEELNENFSSQSEIKKETSNNNINYSQRETISYFEDIPTNSPRKELNTENRINSNNSKIKNIKKTGIRFSVIGFNNTNKFSLSSNEKESNNQKRSSQPIFELPYFKNNQINDNNNLITIIPLNKNSDKKINQNKKRFSTFSPIQINQNFIEQNEKNINEINNKIDSTNNHLYALEESTTKKFEEILEQIRIIINHMGNVQKKKKIVSHVYQNNDSLSIGKNNNFLMTAINFNKKISTIPKKKLNIKINDDINNKDNNKNRIRSFSNLNIFNDIDATTIINSDNNRKLLKNIEPYLIKKFTDNK